MAKFLLWLLFLVHCAWSQNLTQLHYALFTAGGGTGGFSSSCVELAVELAEETINGNSTLLSNYSLSHTRVKNTQVSKHCNKSHASSIAIRHCMQATL